MMKRILTLIAAVAALCACGPKLVILHTNDTHSHMDPLRDGKGLRHGAGLPLRPVHPGGDESTGSQGQSEECQQPFHLFLE